MTTLQISRDLSRQRSAIMNGRMQKTPDVPDDGKAFFGRDAMANYMLVGSMQLGTEIFPCRTVR